MFGNVVFGGATMVRPRTRDGIFDGRRNYMVLRLLAFMRTWFHMPQSS